LWFLLGGQIEIALIVPLINLFMILSIRKFEIYNSTIIWDKKPILTEYKEMNYFNINNKFWRKRMCTKKTGKNKNSTNIGDEQFYSVSFEFLNKTDFSHFQNFPCCNNPTWCFSWSFSSSLLNWVSRVSYSLENKDVNNSTFF